VVGKHAGLLRACSEERNKICIGGGAGGIGVSIARGGYFFTKNEEKVKDKNRQPQVNQW